MDKDSSSEIESQETVQDEAIQEDTLQVYTAQISADAEELQEPENFAETFLFSNLVHNLFEPISFGSKQFNKGKVSFTKRKFELIKRYVEKWRQNVGPNFYPLVRLCLPHRDRERVMYNVKQALLAKLFIKILKISSTSSDALLLKNYKIPGKSHKVGDFAEIAFEVLEKRPFREEPSTWTITQVNEILDDFSLDYKEQNQYKVIEKIYQSFNPTEIKWLIRIILRQLRAGISEKLLLETWHPDAYNLFNVCSSLKRVCYQLTDPTKRLEEKEQDIKIFSCFIPQLAMFKALNPVISTEYWVEEKLDGERIQIHMRNNKFKYFSRRAKDLSWLYGERFDSKNSALTKYLKEAFHEKVYEIILDGEMITWDPIQEAPVPFGSLRAAANSEFEKPDYIKSKGAHPFYNVFDILLLNSHSLVNYPLSERKRCLCKVINQMPKRLEILEHKIVTSTKEIEDLLKDVIQNSSEGLVIKNPKSMYRTNERNDSWIKLKPEYMEEFGENLDLLICGGFYGSGSRGGKLSSFLCALRDDDHNHFKTFCRVGGGFSANDLAEIRSITDKKWKNWNTDQVLKEYSYGKIGSRYQMKPDKWISGKDSVVLQVKAAQIIPSNQYAANITLRFPRFQCIRRDKNYESCSTINEIFDLQVEVEKAELAKFQKKKPLKIASTRKYNILGNDDDDDNLESDIPHNGDLFKRLNFYICNGENEGKSKQQLEKLVKSLGACCFQSANVQVPICIIADNYNLKVKLLEKQGHRNVIRPKWVLDCIENQFLLPFTPSHLLISDKFSKVCAQKNVDCYGDCYYQNLFDTDIVEKVLITSNEIDEIEESDLGIFSKCALLIVQNSATNLLKVNLISDVILAGGGILTNNLDDHPTHLILIQKDEELSEPHIDRLYTNSSKQPYIVNSNWVLDSWKLQVLQQEKKYLINLF